MRRGSDTTVTWQPPPPWQSVIDQNSGRPFYHNPTTGETTWTPPGELGGVTMDGVKEGDQPKLKHMDPRFKGVAAYGPPELALEYKAQFRRKSDKKSGRQRIDYIMLAVHGKKVGIEKVLTMMDNMVDLLKAEQKADSKAESRKRITQIKKQSSR